MGKRAVAYPRRMKFPPPIGPYYHWPTTDTLFFGGLFFPGREPPLHGGSLLDREAGSLGSTLIVAERRRAPPPPRRVALVLCCWWFSFTTCGGINVTDFSS